MSLESGISQTITGKSLKEIKEKLYSLYEDDYIIQDQQIGLKRSLFRQKEVVTVTYSVKHHNAYTEEQKPAPQNLEDKTQKNKEELLNQLVTNGMVVNAISKINDQMGEFSRQLSKINENQAAIGQTVPEAVTKIDEILAQNEFTPAYRKMISEKLQSRFTLSQLEDFSLVQRSVVDWIGDSIEIAEEKVYRPPHVVVIVGPTGVGKTTTLVKMVSTVKIKSSREKNIKPSIVLMTIDTMRVGAEAQLARFGDILKERVLKAESVDDVKEIYDEYKAHSDYFFIDTSGYSPNDSENIGKMKAMLNVQMNSDVYLAVMASTSASVMQNIFRNYETFAYNSVIVTKWEEGSTYGGIISVLWERHKSISYITDGQSAVPRNLKRANKVDILMSLTGFDIDRVHIEEKFGDK